LPFRKIDSDFSEEIFYREKNCIIIRGDCKEVVKKLSGIVKIDLILTDPPYEFQPKGGGVFKDDSNMQETLDAGTHEFDFESHIPPIIESMRKTTGMVNAYFFCNKALVYKYISLAEKLGLTYDLLILRKKRFRPAHNVHYAPDLEYVIFMKSPGAKFNGDIKGWDGLYSKVYDQEVEIKNQMHPNQKPLGILKKYISISTEPGDVVIDPFCGSGQTMLAARELDRFSIGVEKNSMFADVARTVLSQMSLF